MSIKLGVVMDPIQRIHVEKDTTLALLLAASQRGWSLYYMEQAHLSFENGHVFGHMTPLTVHEDPNDWYQLGEPLSQPLAELDVILMRKDPPFDMEYIYTTYLLELAERAGTLVVNKPQSLRDFNEKVALTHFPECAPPLLISRDLDGLYAFWKKHGDIVVKPLHGMGGFSIFRLAAHEMNAKVIFETMTEKGQRFVMAQVTIPDITETGDKRVLIVDGEAIPYALARIPPKDDIRGNLAIGAISKGVRLNERDQFIAKQVGPVLKEKGILLAGLDIIGDYLTEVNITSPTCLREISYLSCLDIAQTVLNAIERHVVDH